MAHNNFNNAIAVRGMVINAAIQIERLMDVCLATFFSNSKEKQTLLVEYVFSTEKMMSWESKRWLLETILKDFYPEEHKKHVKSLREIENKLIPMRNRFAHDHMEYSSEGETDLIGLVKIKGSTKITWHKIEDIKTFTEITERCGNSVSEILDFLKIASQNS